MKFAKYHGLGNDYIVIRPEDFPLKFKQDAIRLICHRHYGVGSDGILLGPLESETCDYGVRILNPDGSEAEKSGNGLRIFARWIFDQSRGRELNFTVETRGGPVSCVVAPDGRRVTVAMGRVSFKSTKIPAAGVERDVLNETMEIDGHNLTFCAASVGNPHCVVLSEVVSAETARRYGPLIETNPLFPRRTNVQFMEVLDRSNIKIEIWERGAGYTLASGSSSTAAAAVAHKLGLCDANITVHMPGGQLELQIGDDYSATMSGPVVKICDGIIADEAFSGDYFQL